MLELTLSKKYIPGTNMQGDLACADWRFLLPSLSLQKILFIGVPKKQDLNVLVRTSDEAIIISENKEQLQKFEDEAKKDIVGNVEFVHVDKTDQFPVEDKSIDLIHVVDAKVSEVLFSKASIAEEIDRVLTPEGSLYFEMVGWLQRAKLNKLLGRLSSFGLEQKARLWLSPFSGELRTALPVNNNKISTYFFKNVLYGNSKKKRAASKIGSLLSDASLLGSVTPRHGILINRNSNGFSEVVPKYIVSMAKESSVDLTGLEYGFSARGKGNSNKVIFFLFEEAKTVPASVVKMTRSSDFNARLENEHVILSELDQNNQISNDTFPQPLFFGELNGTAVLSLKAIDGSPFRTRTTAGIDCPFTKQALDWLVNLGAATTTGKVNPVSELSKALFKLYDRFNEIYSLTEQEQSFLREKLSFEKNMDEKLPLVLQHGDPGTWNMMVTDDDKLVVIDWESGEKKGMPLWDIFYFLQTYGGWMGRQQGSMDPFDNFTRSFLEKSPLLLLCKKTVDEYCQLIDLDKSMVEPLFYSCWMHRALKESARMPVDEVGSGRFINYLKLAIKERDGAGLSTLFSQ